MQDDAEHHGAEMMAWANPAGERATLTCDSDFEATTENGWERLGELARHAGEPSPGRLARIRQRVDALLADMLADECDHERESRQADAELADDTELAAAEVAAAEVAVARIGAAEIGSAEIGSAVMAAAEIQDAEIAPAELGAAETAVAKIARASRRDAAQAGSVADQFSAHSADTDSDSPSGASPVDGSTSGRSPSSGSPSSGSPSDRSPSDRSPSDGSFAEALPTDGSTDPEPAVGPRIPDQGFWGQDEADSAPTAGYKSKHRMAGPPKDAAPRENGRAKPRHAAPPVSFLTVVGRRLAGGKLAGHCAAHAA